MVKYCHKCGARYTEYLDEKRTLCAECKAKKERALNDNKNR